MKIRNVVSSLLLGAVISLPVYANPENSDEQTIDLMAEFADKPEQHQALAKYYKAESVKAQKKVELHRQMRKNYIGYAKTPDAPSALKAHCDELIKADEATIKAYDAMAAEHEKEAQKK